MKALLEFFVRRPLLVNVVMVMFFLTGAMAMTSLSYNTYPPVDSGLISVVTRLPGAGAEDIELSITVPLEQEFLHISGVDKVVSNSIEGESTIMVMGYSNDAMSKYDELETEIYNAIDRARAKMPDNLPGNPIVTRPENYKNTPMAQVLVVGSVPEQTLREISRRVRLELRSLEGVSGVMREGYRDREVQILLDDVKLRRLGISQDQVKNAINSRNVRDSGGSVESAAGEQDILTIGKFENPKDVEDVIIFEGRPGDFVRVKDVARVHYDFADPVVRTSVDGRTAITLLVKASEAADRLSTAKTVKAYLKEKNAALPADVELLLVNDETLATTAMLDVLIANAFAGIVLVVLVLLCFFQFRLTIWVALGIPTAVMMVFTVMPLFDISVNLLTMAALVLMLGILVDDAVVTAESIFRHHEYGHPPEEAAVMGTHKVMLPVFASALTTIVALAPAAFLGGIQGKVFYIVPVMAMLVLVMSLIECKFMLPAHIAHSLKKTHKGAGSLTRPWFEAVEDGYETLMMKVIPHRYVFTAITLVVFFAAAQMATRNIVFVSMPETNADILFVKAEGPIGTPLPTMEKKLALLEQELREIIPAHELAEIVVTAGHHDHAMTSVTEGRDSAWGLLSVFLQPSNKRELNSLELRDQLVELYAQREGFQMLSPRVANTTIGMGYPLETIVLGNSSDRFVVADMLQEYVRGLTGVTEVWSDYVPGKPIISLKIDHNELTHYGLTVGEVSSAVKVAFNGMVVGTFDTVEDTIIYRIKLDGVDVRDPASLYSLAVTNKKGDAILLRSLVEFEQRPGEGTIRHYLGDQATTVYATVDREVLSMLEINRLVGVYIRDNNFADRFPGLSFYQGGELVSETEQAGEVGKALMLSLIAIFFILLLLFHSFLQPVMVLFIIPLGVVGVLVAFVLQGMVLSFAAIIGIAGLMGVIVNDALVMLDRLNTEQRQHSERGETLLHDRQIVECASVRLRPVVITTVTTCAGLFPAAYELGGSNEMITPMIMAMFWGVLIASGVTLFLLPCFYAMERDLMARLNPGYARQTLE
ncbi:MAG: efflux RND transporter permease subunit, partial [Halioglobus sp.]